MRVVVQRVLSASVSIGGAVKSAIGPGLLVLLGVGHEDTQEDLDWLVKKVANLRVFDDEQGVMPSAAPLEPANLAQTCRYH